MKILGHLNSATVHTDWECFPGITPGVGERHELRVVLQKSMVDLTPYCNIVVFWATGNEFEQTNFTSWWSG